MSYHRVCCCDNDPVCEGDPCSECTGTTPGFWTGAFTGVTNCAGCVNIAGYTTTIKGMGGVAVESLTWNTWPAKLGGWQANQDVSCACRGISDVGFNASIDVHKDDTCTDYLLTGTGVYMGYEITATKVKVWLVVSLPDDTSGSPTVAKWGIIFYGEVDKESCHQGYTIDNQLLVGDCGDAFTITTDCGDDLECFVMAYGGQCSFYPCRINCTDSITVTLNLDSFYGTGCRGDGTSTPCTVSAAPHNVTMSVDGTYLVPKTGEDTDTVESEVYCIFYVETGEVATLNVFDNADTTCSGAPVQGTYDFDLWIRVTIWKTSRMLRSVVVGRTNIIGSIEGENAVFGAHTGAAADDDLVSGNGYLYPGNTIGIAVNNEFTRACEVGGQTLVDANATATVVV